MKIFQASFSLLQKIGKALMLPVSVLPVAGILLGVGSAKFAVLPETVSTLMAQAGGTIFTNLPLIFAIATAVGLAGNDGVAALAATVGFLVLTATLGVMATIFGASTKPILGMASIDTGVFGGILVGAVAAYLFNRYYRIKLPVFLGFFAGKRFVPIVTAFASLLLGVILSVAWPPVQRGIDVLSHAAAYGSPTTAAALYGLVERLLIPFGLHHIWNVPFFFEIGAFTKANGEVVHGDITRFFAGDPTAGILAGGFLFKMFGLPAAALAIWQTARPENRARVGSLMASAALTSFLTGITEPLEFSFLFVAPLLYFVHACLVAAGQALFGVLGVKLGYTFSPSLIDYALYFGMGTKAWLLLVVGPFWALLYYGVFRFMIQTFNLLTPGREAADAALDTQDPSAASRGGAEGNKAVELVKAFGGRGNIVSLDACITRLRTELKDVSRASPERLKALGASGVMTVGNGLQAVFGPASENLKSDMEAALRQNLPGVDEAYAGAKSGAAMATGASEEAPPAPDVSDEEAGRRVQAWIPALGGKANIKEASARAGSRVRLRLGDDAKLDEATLRSAGVQAVARYGSGVVHLLVGHAAPVYGEVLRREL